MREFINIIVFESKLNKNKFESNEIDSSKLELDYFNNSKKHSKEKRIEKIKSFTVNIFLKRRR